MSFDSGISSIQGESALSNAQALQNSTAAAQAGSGNLTFDGTVGDLQRKDPNAFRNLVLLPFAYQIVHDCIDQNNKFLEEIKKNRKS